MQISKSKFSFILVLLLNLLQCSALHANEQKQDYKSYKPSCGLDDWTVLPECYELGNKKCKKLCRGFYTEPEYPFPEYGTKEIQNQPIEISADSARFLEDGTSIFKGNVIATEGNKKITSHFAEVYNDKNTNTLKKVYLKDDVRITFPGSRICGSEATYLFQENYKYIKDAKYRMYDKHAHGTANEIKLYGDNLMYMPSGTYTTCAPNDTVWKLKATKIKLNRETGRGEAWNSRLHVKGIPIFYCPYINFPIDKRRKTGFLQPFFTSSNDLGKTLVTPFYWNLAPNYDATFTPYFTTKREFRLLSEARYLFSHSNGIIKFDFLPRDKEYNKFRDESLKNPGEVPLTSRKIAALKEASNRYAFSIKHFTSFTENLLLDLDYTKVSDDNFLHDIGSEIIQSQQYINTSFAATNALLKNTNSSTQYDSTHALLQQATLKYQNYFGMFYSKIQKYQVLHPFNGYNIAEQYQKLPEIGLLSSNFNMWGGFHWNVNTFYTDFKIKDMPYVERRTFGKRYYAKPVISRPFRGGGWFFIPSAKLHHVNYDLHLNQTDRINGKPNTPDKNIPIYDIDAGLIFERDTTVSKQDFIQTLEPRIYYLYVPNKSQDNLPLFDSGVYLFDYNQLFRDNRYSGYDRQSEAQQVSLALSSKFFRNEDDSEKASFNIGQIFYFRDRTSRVFDYNDGLNRTRLNERINNSTKRSPIAILVRYNLCPNWNLESNVAWDKPEKKINTATINLQYKPYKYNVFNVGYSFVRDFSGELDPITERNKHIKQANVSTAWILSRHIRAICKIEYDLQRKNIINILGGFEHYGCCTNFRIVTIRRRTAISTLENPRQYDNSIGFQIVFKGLGGTGSVSRASIASTIPGYEAPLDNEF